MTVSERVIVIGAGPVGLCLSLSLAQAGVQVILIEALGEDNFLEQVPRAGTNHPATLELLDRIGLYPRLESRGIIAPLFHYWDRREHKLIAEFDHVHLKDDTPFPYVLQCERIKIVEEALKLAKAHPGIDLHLATTFTSCTQDADGVTAWMANPAGEIESMRGAYLVSCEGARSNARAELGIEFEGFTYPDRTLSIEVAYDFETTAIPSATTFPIPMNGQICSTGKDRRTAGVFISRPGRRRTRRRSRAKRRCRRDCSLFCRRENRSRSSEAIFMWSTNAWRKNSGWGA